ncbi:MAG: ABC-2 family transporter protein [Candidatus Magasanikbacteria bacterium]|nr:ABC-2 family transporter protein [Candidatus Magasanikbacteria bacterium]
MSFKAYYHIYANYTQRYLIYRARLVIWALVDMVHFLIFPFLWLAIYGSRPEIAGYTREDIVTYYIILSFVSLGFTSHTGRHIRLHIMQGDLSVMLTQPVNYFFKQFIAEASYKIISVIIALVLLSGVFLFAPAYIHKPADIATIFFFAGSLIISFLISHLIEWGVGIGAFWLGEVRATEHAIQIVSIVFSGMIAPLSFFPAIFQRMADVLPFAFMAYVPAQIYLNQMEALEAAKQLLSGLAWVGAIGFLCWIMWRRGLKRYEGVGI